MPAFIKNLTVDCVDALRVARFWAAALGSDVDETPAHSGPMSRPQGGAGPTSGSGATVAPRPPPTVCTWTCVR